MNTQQLNAYLAKLEGRIRLATVWQGLAIAAAAALGATVALVMVANVFAFSAASLTWSRIALFLSLSFAIGFALVLPLLRINRRRTAGRAEQTFPQFEQRLLTFAERSNAHDPFVELLAEDAGLVAVKSTPQQIITPQTIFAMAGSFVAAAGVLLWLVLAGPGYLGHGASLLWAGMPKDGVVRYYDIQVEPGNRTVRRKSDQAIRARLIGFMAPQVRLFAKFNGTAKWEPAPMRPANDGYEFVFASLNDSVEYYVEAAGVKSGTFKLTAADLPNIGRIRVVYHYPAWLGMPDATEDPGGDLRAVEGSVADVSAAPDKAVANGVIILDDGTRIPLKSEGGRISAAVPIKKDGMYHFASIEGGNTALAKDSGQEIRLSEDFFIEARHDSEPIVKITRPGRDAKVNPVEEVPVAVEGEDDFGLRELNLHYSVNGGPEKTIALLNGRNVKKAEGQTVLSLEDFKMQPGDVVGIYATARDARQQARTDMFFIEAQPFEREYSQSQESGGGGGGDQDQTPISQRQKEIISATSNALRGGPAASGENAKFVSDMQTKLKAQAQTLIDRMKARQLSGTNQDFQAFVKEMELASASMGPAADKLKAQAWKDALSPEQVALQHLLRAEALRRQIQVAFGNKGGGGGGQGRDLDNLFDLELDTEKNQYETGQQQSSAEQRQKDIDEALQKLEQLARRQQELADQQKRDQKANFDQRWQQEMLRREAEELRKEMEKLQRGSQAQQSQQQGGQQSQSQSGQSGQQSQSGQNGQQSQQPQQQQAQQQQSQQQKGQQPQMSQSTQERRLKEAFDRISKATEDMRRAQQQSQSGQSGQQGQETAGQDANARRAAERLNEAKDILGGMRRQESSSQLESLAERAARLAQQQKDFANRLQQEYGNKMPDPRTRNPQPSGDPQKAQQFAKENDQLRDELEKLEKEMQKAAREMAGTQPGPSSKVREALGDMQGSEIKQRMKLGSQWIRQGLGAYMAPQEEPITQGIENVRDKLQAARSAMDKNGDKNGKGAGKEGLEQALSRVEQLRGQLQRGRQNGQGQQQDAQQPGQQSGQQNGQQGGQQPGQQQGGQQSGKQQGGQQPGGQQPGQQQGGQQSGQQPGGQQPGGQQQGGQPQGGQQAGQTGGRQGGTWNGGGSYAEGPAGRDPWKGGNRQIDVDSAARELAQIRQGLMTQNPELAKEIGDIMRELQKATMGATQGPELSQRLDRQVLPNIEQLELMLRRKLEEQNGGQVRSGAGDKVPPGYGEAVAEYFRKLSKGK